MRMNLFNAIALAIAISLIILSACSQAQDSTVARQATLTGQKILIVYVSRTNNTRAIAEIIHKNV